MRPLVLISGLAAGGAERVTVTFLRRLQARGMQVPVCTVTGRHDGALAREVNAAELRRYDLGARRLADPRALLRLVRLIRRERIDMIHAHGQDASIIAHAACFLTRTALIVTRHVLEEPGGNARERLRARLALTALRKCDLAVAVSDAAAARLSALSGRRRDSIAVIRNGIELGRFEPARCAPDGLRIRRALGMEDARIVLMPAVMRPGKGHDVMLDAFARVARAQPLARLLLAGTGPLEAGLRDRAAPLGDAVKFLGHREDMAALLSAADIVALPSAAEALPTVLLEAAAAARPVVATAVGGTAEIVKDCRTGWLVDAGDAAGLADGIVALLADPDRAHRFGAEGRALAEKQFGIDRQIDATLEVWRRTAGPDAP